MEINSSSPMVVHHGSTDQLSKLSQKLEATFIAEMLKVMEPTEKESSFGGGIGEQQFQSFLLEQRAAAIAKKGGLGLSAHFQASLSGGVYGKA